MDSFNYNPDQGKKDKQIESKLENYADPEGLTTKQLERGLWLVEHKRQFRLALYGALIIIAAVSWVYTIYGFAYYLAAGMKQDEKLLSDLVQTQNAGHDYVLSVSAKDLAATPAGVLRSGDRKYDFYSLIKNDNLKWWAEFQYYFSADGQATAKMKGYILPGESKYFSALAQEMSYQPSEVRLIMENINWHRLNQHEIPDWNTFRSSRLNIETADVKFTPASQSQLSEKLNLNQLSFNAINRTAFNYWETGFTILLEAGGQVVNINHYSLTDFMSGQKRPITLSWPGSLGRVDSVEIIPEINIMENDIYIPYEGGTGQPSGGN